jgi:hypothetical protein
MKKVSLLGLVGVAPTAVGFAIPAPSAAAAVTHSPRNAGKTVSLMHGKTQINSKILANCPSTHFNYGSKGLFSGFITYSHQCVHSQEGLLYKGQTGLTERARFYSGGGYLERTTWLRGHISLYGHKTSFRSYPSLYAHEVCQALVASNNHTIVKYGPVCEFTS